ncbi:MAG: hypothetical protein KJ043_05545 [Anaerolineae bacterium]|nr:hypothetical protein [Anaerolineae bacterium]
MVRTIELPVDDELVEIFASASDEYRQKIGMLVSLWAKEWQESSPEKLLTLMRQIGENAQARGLTPDILEELLADDD